MFIELDNIGKNITRVTRDLYENSDTTSGGILTYSNNSDLHQHIFNTILIKLHGTTAIGSIAKECELYGFTIARK